jgi:hypothetical protein
MHEILYTSFQATLLLPSAVSSRYYNCCRDGSTSPGNYGYDVEVESEVVIYILFCLVTRAQHDTIHSRSIYRKMW